MMLMIYILQQHIPKTNNKTRNSGIADNPRGLRSLKVNKHDTVRYVSLTTLD